MSRDTDTVGEFKNRLIRRSLHNHTHMSKSRRQKFRKLDALEGARPDLTERCEGRYPPSTLTHYKTRQGSLNLVTNFGIYDKSCIGEERSERKLSRAPFCRRVAEVTLCLSSTYFRLPVKSIDSNQLAAIVLIRDRLAKLLL